MATMNGSQNRIHRILIIGDNRIAASILSGLSPSELELHQTTHPQSLLESEPGVKLHKIDSSLETLTALLHDVKPDLIFSTQAAGSFDTQRLLVDSAVAAGVQKFVLAEFGQDSLNEGVQRRLPPYKERARFIQHLKDRDERIEWVGVATGCSLERAILDGDIGFDLKWQSATLHGTGKERFAASSTAWIGRVAEALVQKWDGIHKGQYLYASGMIVSAHEILDTLQHRTGQGWETGQNDVEEIVREAESRFERGFPDAGMFLMERAVLFDESVGAVRPFVERDAKGMLGLEGESLDVVIDKILHEFKHHGGGDCGCG